MFSPEVPGAAPAVRPDFSPFDELDLAFVRERFPALAGEWIFLDNAGGSQVLATVADRGRDYLLSSSVQLGASYDVSRLAAERVAAGARAAATLGNRDPREVALRQSPAHGGRRGASHDVARRAAERVAEGARAAATLVNGDPGEIVLGQSSTQLLQNLARSLAEELRPGDEIVVTNSDHEANVTPWVRLEERDV